MKKGILVAASLIACAASSASGVDLAIPGKAVVVQSRKLAKFKAKGTFSLPAPGGANDPTLVGADFRAFDTDEPGAGTTNFALDSSGWVGLGDPPGSTGYKYKGRDDITDADPKGTCKVVLLKERIIKAVCKGSAVTLVTPFAASTGIRLGIPAGSASLRYCATFGGEESDNSAKLTKRKDAPAPEECPGVPQDRRPCGDTAVACHGECPASEACNVDPFGPGECVCAPETSIPCQETGGLSAALCGGACPDGLSCAAVDLNTSTFEATCACLPSDAAACAESAAPACGGTCPTGLSCQPGGLGSFSCLCK